MSVAKVKKCVSKLLQGSDADWSDKARLKWIDVTLVTASFLTTISAFCL